MASAPNPGLPLFYNELTPLSSNIHGEWRTRTVQGAPFVKNIHAIPLLAEEFIPAQRCYPIVFSIGDNPVPLALMGLNEGVNVFADENGAFPDHIYVPAYVRRYPFMLARLRPEAEELSLCFDPTSEALGPFDEGAKLFDGDQPSEQTKSILGFCESFEQAAQTTSAFLQELKSNDLLIDGEAAIQVDGQPQPYVYRGFQTVSEDALKNIRGDLARRWMQNGLLPLVYAHLFSLGHMTMIFARQMQQGKVPPQVQPVPMGA
ncbi:MAG TPA: SapC family protein [Sphingomonas sp.]|nr:SapC family protein [Sphingomonas sp.]